LKSKIIAITVALALVLSLVFAVAGPVAAAPTTWNVTGTWIFSYGALYDLNLTQTGSALSGNAGYPAGTVPPYKNCPETWKEIKLGIAGKQKREEFIKKLKTAIPS
jgi:hypothetical protein